MQVALGSLGSLSLAAGKLSIAASLDGGAVVGSVTVDAGMFVDQLEALVAAAIPASAPIDPAIFAVLKAALIAIQ